MNEIKGTTITLTRGDSFYCSIVLTKNESPYVPQAGDSIRFVLKRNFFDTTNLIEKTIPTDSLILYIEPADTRRLDFGTYAYDIEMTYANGDIDTFINNAKFVIAPEVATWTE